MVESSTPPAIAMAKGGQNWLPSSISGRKPPKVVTVVETIWRLESITTERIANRLPLAALPFACNAVMMMMAALIDTPIEPITPISA